MILGSEQYLNENFRKVADGWHAYKVFGSMRPPRPDWILKAGSWIIDPGLITDTANTCAAGINVATGRLWIENFMEAESLYGIFNIWLVFIPDDSTIVVPFETDGKIRTNRLQLVEIVGEIDRYYDDDENDDEDDDDDVFYEDDEDLFEDDDEDDWEDEDDQP